MADISIKVLQPADSYALLTLDELKVILNLPVTDTSEDAQLQDVDRPVQRRGRHHVQSRVRL